jgi:hypothetical protein
MTAAVIASWVEESTSSEVQGVAAMVIKAAVVFIAGGLMGSGLVALTRLTEAVPPAARTSEATAVISPFKAATHVPDWSVELLQAQKQPAYIQARFAAQRPFAALHPPQR